MCTTFCGTRRGFNIERLGGPLMGSKRGQPPHLVNSTPMLEGMIFFHVVRKKGSTETIEIPKVMAVLGIA